MEIIKTYEAKKIKSLTSQYFHGVLDVALSLTQRKKESFMKKILVVAMLVCVTLMSAFAQGSSESSGTAKIDRDITIYVTVKAGGALDVRARVLADYLKDELGVNVTVNNVPGAGGVTCATQFLTNPSGPYDMMFGAASIYTAGPAFDSSCIYSIDNFRVLAPVDVEEFGLFVSKDASGFESFDDVINYAKNNELIFGCGGIANVTYIYQAALYKTLGLKYNTLIHNGGIEGITNCMGGHNKITMCGLETARPYVENGSIIPVLTFNKTDYTGYSGYTVPSVMKYTGNEENTYNSLMEIVCLASLDDAHAEILEAAVAKCLSNPDCIRDLEKCGLNYIPEMTNEEVVDSIKKEASALSAFVKQLT